MSADRRATMGVKHLTVVPENFEPVVGGEDADGSDDTGEDDDRA